MNTQKNQQVLHFIQKSISSDIWGVRALSNSYFLWIISISIVYLWLGLLFLKIGQDENNTILQMFNSYLYLLLMTEWFFLYFKITFKQPKFISYNLKSLRLFSQLFSDYVIDFKLFTFILPLPFYVYVASGTRIIYALVATIILIIYYFILQLLYIIALMYLIKYPKIDNFKHLVWPILITIFSFGIINQAYLYYKIFPPIYFSAHSISSCINGNYLNTALFTIVLILILISLWYIGILTIKNEPKLEK